MKSAYRQEGYTVAGTSTGLVIAGEMWGVSINEKAIPNKVKSVIVLHAGKLPEVGEAINVRKGETSSMIYDLAVAGIDRLDELYRDKKCEVVAPTRLTMDGYRLWQEPRSFKINLIDPENQQILDYGDQDAYLVGNAIYGETVYGSVFVLREVVDPENKAMLAHLEQMQWIPVELE
jgi:hypothetical protein